MSKSNSSSPSDQTCPPPPLRVGGVPEHFNYVWHMARERGIFARHGVEVEFVTMKLGTGAMIKAVKDGECDMVVALTEGLVRDIAMGSDLRLLGTYVKSPLCWAISAAGRGDSAAKIKSVKDLRGATFGVSRMGSGSHLMAVVLADERGWDPNKDVKFSIKGNFKQLRDGVNDSSTDAFMWETFTTKPFHDSGEVRRVGDITTPWPCFMLAARHQVVTEKQVQLQHALAAVNEAAGIFRSEVQTMPQEVATRYELKPEDARAWYRGVDIVAERFVSETALRRVLATLKKTGQLPTDLNVDPADILDQRLGELRRDLRAMKLYDRSDLVVAMHRRLAHEQLEKGPLEFTQLLPFDQHHYHGVEAVRSAAKWAGLRPDMRVINVGSGLGGPARLLAGEVGCQVLACEIQDDLHRTALELTERCGLSERVHHMAGDFLKMAQHLQRGAYGSVLSWLTVLHFSDRGRFFRLCYGLLQPGGTFYAADFVAAGALSHGEWKVLREEVGCSSMAAGVQAYAAELRDAGFQVEKVENVTDDWRAYTDERATAFADESDALVKVYGEDTYAQLLKFYQTVAKLYAGGNLGGIQIVARKPLGW